MLSDDELTTVYHQALAEVTTYTKLVRLLILTGQRMKQMTHLRGEYIDRKKKQIEWPPELMKSNRRHLIPYGDLAAEVIKTLPEIGYVFPARGKPKTPLNGQSKLKRNFDEVSGVTGYTHHDFRRTMRTGLASLRVPREHAENCAAAEGYVRGAFVCSCLSQAGWCQCDALLHIAHRVTKRSKPKAV